MPFGAFGRVGCSNEVGCWVGSWCWDYGPGFALFFGTKDVKNKILFSPDLEILLESMSLSVVVIDRFQ